MKLTAKQEAFAQAVASGKTQADAYREAYDAEGMTDKTVWERASVLAAHDKVRARVEALLAEIAAKTVEKLVYSAEDAVRELEEARLAAMTGDKVQASAAVAATKAKAEILGLVTQKIEHSGAIVLIDLVKAIDKKQFEKAAIEYLHSMGWDIEP